MKTFSPKPEDIKRHWWIVDARDMVLGRLATRLATRLRGKDKPTYAPHVDSGDFVVVINADKIRTTGDKMNKKVYYRHSGYPGGIKSSSLKRMHAKDGTRMLRFAVKGMLPKGSLGRAMAKKLRIYSGSEHPHAAQQPEDWKIQ